MEEASNVLIFLKSVKSIQLYTKSNLQSEPQRIFSVNMPQNYLNLIDSNKQLSQHVEDRTFHESILVTIHLYPITSSCGEDRVWLVLNMIGFPQSHSLSGFYTEHELTYLPWIGLAIETGISGSDLDESRTINFRRNWDGIDIQDVIDEFIKEFNFPFKIPTEYHLTSDSGKLFCFLPTPEHTDLPVNIHGYFALTNDRRQIKWPSLDSKDTDSNWNKLLVEQLGVSAYVIFYNILVHLFHHENPECYQYMMLGGENLKKQSLILVNQGLEILADQNIVYSYITKRWIRIREGIYHSSSYTHSQGEIQALLEVLREPLVLLSASTLAVFSRIRSLREAIERNTISPVLVRQLLRKHSNETQLTEFFATNITGYTGDILAYVLSDSSLCDVVRELEGIPLLQLANRDIVKFANSPHKFYLYDDKFYLIRLFPGIEHLFVDPDIPHETYSLLLSFSKMPNCEINLRDISDIKSDLPLLKHLFQLSINSHFGHNNAPLDWNSNHPSFNCEWIKLIWSLIGCDTSLAASLRDLPLLPRCQLSCDTNQLLSVVSAGYILHSADNKYTSLQSLLTECSSVFIHSHRFVECLDDLVIKSLPGGLLPLLQRNTHVLSKFIHKLTQTSDKQIFNLITEILNENSTFDNSQIILIKILPIFPTMTGTCTSLCTSYVRVPDNIDLPPLLSSYPIEYLSPDNYTTNLLYRKIGVCATVIDRFVRDNILCFINGIDASDHFTLSKWLFNSLNKLDSTTTNKLREFSWIVDNTNLSILQPNGYHRPNQLFCYSDDDTLSALLPCDSKYFAHEEYNSYSYITKKNSLFLSSSCLANQKIFEEVTESAVQYFYLDIQDPNCSSLWKRRFSTLLQFVMNCWQTQRLHMNTISTTLKSSPIVLPCYTRPDGYPTCLPFLGRYELTTLHSVVFCSKQDIPLVGSVRVCVPFSQHTPLLEYLGCETKVTSGMVVDQLNLIVKCKIQSADSENINSLLNRIYLSKLILNGTNIILPNFVYVRNKNIFIKARQVVRSSEICLEPFYYSFERLNYSQDTWSLLVKCGAHEKISSEAYYEILHRLYTQQNESVPDYVELVISIILALNKSNYQYNHDVAYLLGADEFLHPATDCVFHDSTTHAGRMKVENQGITYYTVHARIPSCIASRLGAKSLKITMLGGFWKYKGQFEKLTTRLHSILKEYESKIDVFKELLQNADDAKAGTAKLLIDYTSHSKKYLIQSTMEVWQGAALYFYNDAQFTEDDFENIMKIFGQTKRRDTSKIGKYGLGFNTVYHLTDLPSFVSGEYIHMLDPTRSFLADSGQAPGIQVDFVRNRECMLKLYKDQFSVFNIGLFNCNVFNAVPFSGTLFRLPFRIIPSDISATVYTESVIEDLLSQILQQAESSILFLQHIKCIEVYKRTQGSDPILLLKVSKNELINPFKHHETFNSRYKEHIEHILQLESVRPEVYHQKICVTSECVRDGKKDNEFIVSYSTGTQQCVDFLRNKGINTDNYTPVSSVALPLSTIREYSHDTPAYNLYCYLPLPVTSPYLMYINGFFALDHSRRGIACTEDASDRTKWNVALISDALVNAFINLFLHTREYFSNQNLPLSHFYRLWPLDKQTQFIVWREFPKAFVTRLIEENASLFYCESHSDGWIGYREASFLYYEYCYDHDSLRTFYDFVRGQLLQYNIYLIDISVSFQETHLFQIIFENDTDKQYRLEMICSRYIFPNIHTLELNEVNLVLSSLLPIINSVEPTWLIDLFSETPCIPSGSMTFLLPSRVVSPHSPLVKLYSPSDERTVHPELEYLFKRSSKYLIPLRKMGIIEFTLPEEDIIDRCKCQINFQYQSRIEHCMIILKYINDKQFLAKKNEYLKTQLARIEFIPVWEDKFLIQIGLQKQTGFARPNQCYPYSSRDIICPGYYAISEEVDKFTYLKTFLSINKTNGPITVQNLIDMLEVVREKESDIITLNLQDELSRRAEVIYKMIFSLWEKKELLKNNLRYIWHSGINSFHQLSHLFIPDKYSHYHSRFLATFPYKLTSSPSLQQKFLIFLGVQKSISHKDAYRILTDMSMYYRNGVIPEMDVNLVIDLVNNYFVDYGDYRFSNNDPPVLLSSDLRLCTASALCIDDMPWVVKEIYRTSHQLVHKNIHPISAYNLGARSYRSNHFVEQEFEEFGQHEDIADRITGLKREFPCGTTILKELLQNAEDAGATEVAFVLDNTNYSSKTESLCLSKEIHPNWYKYQTYTSLLVYNNSSFSEKDLKGIQKVGLGGKKGMQSIGKFGLGFNAVYHLTDSPCLLTRRNSDQNISFCVFDPFRRFLRLRPGSLPGKRFNFDSDKFDQFPDQFSPYTALQSLNTPTAGLFPTLTKGEYTIFRLPFTDLSYSRKVEKILSDFLQNSSNLNLFLENVHRISVYRLDTNVSEMLGTFTLSVTSLPLYTPPPSFKGNFLTEIHISKREISIVKSTVISPTDYMSSLGKRGRGDSTSSTWLLFTHKGSIQSLEACCPGMKKHKRNYENEKLTHEVYGGVAVNLTTSTTLSTGSCLYSYLPIGDDRPMNFPILINAPFILEPERQHIRFRDVDKGEPNWEDEWHSALIQHVIAPLFASLLFYLRRNKVVTLPDYYSWYYTLFPDVIHLNKVNQVYSNFIYALCKQLYTVLYDSNEQILADRTCTQFYSLHGENRGIFPDTSVLCSPIYPVTTILSSPYKRIRNALPEGDLYSTLAKLKFPLTCAPHHIKSSFKEFSFTLTVLSQNILLDYLSSNHSNYTMSDIEILLDYLFKANSSVTDSYQNIHLKIDYTRKLSSFIKTDITFYSHYADLLPQCAHRFINPHFPNASIELLKKHGFIQEMSPDFLSENLRISDCKNTECCLFWKFILESQLPSHKLISQFGKFPLIPIIGKSSYSLISNLPAILIQPTGTSVNLHLHNAMMKLQCLQLGLNTLTTPSFDVNELTKYLQPLIISNTVLLSQFLSAARLSDVNKEDVDLTKNEASAILDLFPNNTEMPRLDSGESKIISELKIFQSHQDSLCSISHFHNCFINTSSFKIGLELHGMLTRDKITIFKNSHKQNHIIKQVVNTCHINMISETSFFLVYVLKYFTQLATVEQREMLLFLQNNISKPYKNDFINRLKYVKFIKRGLNLVTVSDCYSPQVDLFKVYFPTELLPEEWSELLLTYSIISELGLRNKADLQSIVTAAERIYNGTSILTSQEKLIPLSSLVSVIQSVELNSHEISLLQRLSNIKFLPVRKYVSISKTCTQKYLSFSEAELHEHTYSCCMATYIHDQLVSSIRTVGANPAVSYLNIRSKPDVHTVITHLELICKEFNQVNNNHGNILERMFFDSYRFLQNNCDQSTLFQKFNLVKCILYENELFYPRNIVFSLDTKILDYLFKASDALKPYYNFLTLVGVTQSADYSHYSAVMSDLYNDTSLSNARKTRVGKTTFLKFISTLRKAEDTGCNINLILQNLMVLSDHLEIVPVHRVVYIDNTRLKVHVQLFPDLCNQLNFLLDLPPNSLSSCEPPACLNIRHLSNLITETLDPTMKSATPAVRYQNESRQIEYKLKCSEFARGLIRIYNHTSITNLSLIRIKKDIVKDISKDPSIANDPLYLTCFQILQNLSVKVVSRLLLQISDVSNVSNVSNVSRGHYVTKDGIYDCFIEDSVLYVNGANIRQFNFLYDLTYALNLLFANIFNDMLLQYCLSCENTCDIMVKLDSLNVQPCHFLDDIPLPPSPVKPAPAVPTSSRRKPAGVTRPSLLHIIHSPTTSSSEISPEDEFIGKLWIQTAQCDLLAAKKLVCGDLPPVFTSHACNNCFECAIKVCIAILYIHRYNRTNISYERNLDILMNLVKDKFSGDVFTNFSSRCVSLMNFDDDSKNPLIIPGIGCCIPMEQCSLKTANEAIQNASELLEIVRKEFSTMKKLMLTDGQCIQPATRSLMMAQLESCELNMCTFCYTEIEGTCTISLV